MDELTRTAPAKYHPARLPGREKTMGIERKIARQQLDSWHVSRYPKARAALLKKPLSGWIRTVRYVLGMSGRQLAERLGVSKNSVSAMEKREREGTVTIRTMMRVAEAMDCTFFYGFLPNGSFEDIVRRRAEAVARGRMERIDGMMKLEGQELPRAAARKAWEREVVNLVDHTPGILWETGRPPQGNEVK